MSLLRKYRVVLLEKTYCEVFLEAADELAAEDAAIALLQDDIDQFRHIDGSLDVVQVEEVQP